MAVRYLGIALLASLCACRSAAKRPPQPIAASQGAIFGSVVLRGHEFPNIIPHRAEEMYFAQVLPDGKLDEDRPLLTNVNAGGQVYLLDVPPGRYVPLTASWYHHGLRYQARLPLEEAKLWAVDVGPGQIAYLGANTLRTEWMGFGQAALNFLKQAAHYVAFAHPTTDIEISTPRVDREPAVEAHALREAREALKGTLWVAAIDARLTALGNPPDPETTGLVFKKEKPRQRAGPFTYIDTLAWGQPTKAPGGLRWREPKGRAEVVVMYLQPGAEGYKPRERYLDEMRDAGSPEDAHVLAEVALSSRTVSVARYTTYVYPEGALTGSAVRVFRTETVLVPAADGYYVLRYRAIKESFDDFYASFKHFAQHVEYSVPLNKTRAGYAAP